MDTKVSKARKILRTLAGGAVVALVLVSCGADRGKARALVDALNSPEFRARELQTGFFTGSEAKIEGDTLVFTVDCAEKIVIAELPPRGREFLEQSAALELSSLCSDEGFREGMEALRDERMGMKIVWRDTRGAEIAVAISPASILGAE